MYKYAPHFAVIFAALLWSIDALLRQSLYTLPALLIITIEHGIGTLLFIPFNNEANISAGKNLALLTSILTFIESLRLWLFFDSGEGAFQYYTYLD